MVPDRPYCRLTVLAPRHRVDVALPADVPVAELVPMLLELLGEPAGRRWQPAPWRLTGVAGGPLPAAATLVELGVLDGELLRLSPAPAPPAPPVFDDPVDELASTAAAGAGDRRFGGGGALTLTTGAAFLLAAAGPGTTLAAVIAGVCALACMLHAARLVRRPFDVRTADAHRVAARTAALAAVPLAAAAGWTALPGVPVAGPLLLAVAGAGTVAAVAQVVLRVIAPALVAVVIAATLAAAGVVGMRFGLSAAAAAAAAGAVAVVAGPLLPRAAIRLAGLPRPVIPTEGSELLDADSGPDLLPPEELAERADLARGYLAGLVGGCAVVAASGAVVAATATGWAGPAFAGVTVAVLGLRARGYADPAPARTSLGAGIGAALALAGIAGVVGGQAALPLAAGALLVAGGAGLLAVGRTRPMNSPVARRAVDLLEGLLVAAAVPLALGAMDLYRVIRGL